MSTKKSFWERITGGARTEEEYEEPTRSSRQTKKGDGKDKRTANNWIEEENEEAELAVDVYQTGTDIIVQTFVAGVKPEDLELSIARDMITVTGKREEHRNVDEGDYFTKELYWGKFSRSVILPQEVDAEKSEANIKEGVLTVWLPKLNRQKSKKLKVKPN